MDPATAAPPRPGLAARALVALIRCYQLGVSPLLGPRCRYLPTCSAYAREAVERFGAARGAWLALRRILRCHPFSEGGPDPVPERFSWRRGGHRVL